MAHVRPTSQGRRLGPSPAIRAIDALHSLRGRRRPLTRFLSRIVGAGDLDADARNTAGTRCGLCRELIARVNFLCVVSKGETYHAGCWERKIRQQTSMKKSA